MISDASSHCDLKHNVRNSNQYSVARMTTFEMYLTVIVLDNKI